MRLQWPYGDYYPGSFQSKTVMPIFVLAIAAMLRAPIRKSVWPTIFVFVSFFGCLITGERVNSYLKVLAGSLFVISEKFKPLNFALIVVFGLIALAVYENFNPIFSEKIMQAWHQISVFSESNYLKTINGGLQAALHNPLIGVGVDNFGPYCKTELLKFDDVIRCNVHPHHYFTQIAAETGFVGLGLFLLFCVVFLRFCFSQNQVYLMDTPIRLSFIVFLTLFFPVQTTADFFGQWNNICIWSAIGVAAAFKLPR